MILKLLLGAILLILLSFSLGWFIISLSKNEAKLNKRLDDLQKKTKLAETITELNDALTEWTALNDLCWHKIHGTRLTIIRTVIQLKIDNINTKKSEFKFDFDL